MAVYFGTVVFNSAVQANLDALPNIAIVTEISAEQVVILESIKMRTACLLGSFSGALLFFALNTVPMSAKDIASKTLASFVGGVIVSPVIIHMSRSPLTTDYIIAISGTVAFLFVTMIAKTQPMLMTYLLKKLGMLSIEADQNKSNDKSQQ